MSTRWKLLTEVAPAKPGSGDTPAVGATYRCAYAAEGLHAAPATCFDLFKCVCACVCVCTCACLVVGLLLRVVRGEVVARCGLSAPRGIMPGDAARVRVLGACVVRACMHARTCTLPPSTSHALAPPPPRPTTRSSAEAHPHKPCLGWRPVLDGAGTLGPYAWMTYGEAYQRSVKVGAWPRVVTHGVCVTRRAQGW
jgi:hypothetical protein